MALRMRVNALFKKSAPEAPKKAAKAVKVTKAGSKKTKGWLGESQGGAVNLDKWYGERRAPAPAREASGQQGRGGGASGATEVLASSACGELGVLPSDPGHSSGPHGEAEPQGSLDRVLALSALLNWGVSR
jgi:hypothetical protein